MSWSQQRWELAWQTIKDLLLTGTGMALILSQIFSASPSDVLLVTGLALTVPSVAGHARVLLDPRSAGHGLRSSPSTPPSGSSSSSPSPGEGEGE